MKKTFWTIAAGLAFLLASCGSPPPTSAVPTPPQPVAPVETVSPDVVIASAEVRPAQEARLSFPIAAPVKEALVKEGDVVAAGQTLATLYTPDLEGQLKAAEYAEKAGELDFQYWIPYRHDRPPERKQQAQAEWEQKKMALETARAALTQSYLTAPFSATVIDVSAQPGEYVQAGQVVMTLADLANMQIVTTDLSERDIVRVKEGQTVSIYIEALNLTVSGKVARIAPVSQTVGGDVVFPVTITLDEQVNGLLWGMSAEVEIQTK